MKRALQPGYFTAYAVIKLESVLFIRITSAFIISSLELLPHSIIKKEIVCYII